MDLDPGELVALPAGTVLLRDARRGREAELRLEPFQIARTTAVPFGRDRPVHGVTWFDAIAVCNDLSDAAGLEHAYAVEGRRVHWDLPAGGFRQEHAALHCSRRGGGDAEQQCRP